VVDPKVVVVISIWKNVMVVVVVVAALVVVAVAIRRMN
jgi:hypothetical protein